MAEKATVARPYARAVFELARDNDALTDWSKMLVNASLVSTDDRVESLFTDPRVSTQQLADLITGICGDGLNELGQNFIRVLSQYRRLDVLPEITALYELQKAEYENSVDVSVTSAVAFDEKQRKQLIASLKERLGRDIRLHCETDENLIGGAIIRADDLVIDGSLRGKLSRLAAEMTH